MTATDIVLQITKENKPYTDMDAGSLLERRRLMESYIIEYAKQEKIKLLEKTTKMLNYVKCVQNCNKGVVGGGDNIQQCQWCDEVEELNKELKNLKDE